MINDTNSILQCRSGSRNILDVLLEDEIHNIVSVVSDSRLIPVWLVVRAVTSAEHSLASRNLGKGCDGAQGVHVAERSDLNREREGRAKALAQLGVVNNADELLGHDLHHLLTQKSSTTTLDKGEIRVHSIRSVDGHIKLRLLVQSAEGDVKALSLLAGALAGGDANDILELTALELLPNTLNCKVGRGTRTEANDHATFNVIVDRLVPCSLLGLVDSGELCRGQVEGSDSWGSNASRSHHLG
mmetsp:Transcript_42076/g.85905  ORF Transcript_42076/g.85905 Transcript_42076/m.85905 type:complete len:243 (-) Transcript_42076:131-859(-)